MKPRLRDTARAKAERAAASARRKARREAKEAQAAAEYDAKVAPFRADLLRQLGLLLAKVDHLEALRNSPRWEDIGSYGQARLYILESEIADLFDGTASRCYQIFRRLERLEALTGPKRLAA